MLRLCRALPLRCAVCRAHLRCTLRSIKTSNYIHLHLGGLIAFIENLQGFLSIFELSRAAVRRQTTAAWENGRILELLQTAHRTARARMTSPGAPLAGTPFNIAGSFSARSATLSWYRCGKRKKNFGRLPWWGRKGQKLFGVLPLEGRRICKASISMACP